MAQYNVTVNYEPFFSSIIVTSNSGGTAPNNRLVLAPNDTVVFTNQYSSNATVSGQGTLRFNTNNLLVPANGSGTLTVKSTATSGTNDASIFLAGDTFAFYFEVVSNVDLTPDSYDMGQPATSVEPSIVYSFAPFIVRGISEAVSIGSTNCQFQKNGAGSWFTSSSVAPNDSVQVRATAPSSFNTILNMSMNIGGVTDSNTLRTKNNPADGTRLYFPKTTRPVSLKDVTQHFAAPITAPQTDRVMSNFRKGGPHVPNIPENLAVTDTNQNNDLTLGQFLTGTATLFTFDVYPQNKFISIGTRTGTRTLGLNWSSNIDWELGYSPLTEYNVEYRYVHTPEVNLFGETVTFSSSGPSTGSYSSLNTTVSIAASAPPDKFRYFSGKITMYMRSLINPNLILTEEFQYALQFEGELEEAT